MLHRLRMASASWSSSARVRVALLPLVSSWLYNPSSRQNVSSREFANFAYFKDIFALYDATYIY